MLTAVPAAGALRVVACKAFRHSGGGPPRGTWFTSPPSTAGGALGIRWGPRNVLSVTQPKDCSFLCCRAPQVPPPSAAPDRLASRWKYHELLRRGLWGLGGRSRSRGKDDWKKPETISSPTYISASGACYGRWRVRVHCGCSDYSTLLVSGRRARNGAKFR